MLHDPDWADPEDWKQDLANAHLIAAAPELLEALKGILKLIRDGKLHGNTSDDPDPDPAARQRPFILALTAAASAIDKAEAVRAQATGSATETTEKSGDL